MLQGKRGARTRTPSHVHRSACHGRCGVSEGRRAPLQRSLPAPSVPTARQARRRTRRREGRASVRGRSVRATRRAAPETASEASPSFANLPTRRVSPRDHARPGHLRAARRPLRSRRSRWGARRTRVVRGFRSAVARLPVAGPPSRRELGGAAAGLGAREVRSSWWPWVARRGWGPDSYSGRISSTGARPAVARTGASISIDSCTVATWSPRPLPLPGVSRAVVPQTRSQSPGSGFRSSPPHWPKAVASVDIPPRASSKQPLRRAQIGICGSGEAPGRQSR